MSDVLDAEVGRELGSRPSGRLRRSGKIPAVLYGLGMEPTPMAIEWPALRRALTTGGGMSTPVRLRVSGKEHLTIIKDLQRHPVRRDVLHVDFLVVDPDEPVTVEVPLVLSGVEELGASIAEKVTLVLHSLSVTAKPNALPAEVVVDVGGIGDGDIRVGTLALPQGVSTDIDPDIVVVSLVATELAPELAEEEAAAEAEAAEEAEAGAEGEAEAAAEEAE